MCRNALREVYIDIRKCTSPSSMRNWCPSPSRCSWKSVVGFRRAMRKGGRLRAALRLQGNQSPCHAVEWQ